MEVAKQRKPDGLDPRGGRPHIAAMDETIDWRVLPGLAPYADTLAAMEARAAAIRGDGAPEAVWLVEHPPLYTAGTSADPAELLAPQRFPVFATGRGGRYTYHGPGQRTGYVMLDLDRRGRDVRLFVHSLEDWLIAALALIGVAAWRAEGRIGIWTQDRSGREAKVGAIGVRVRRWVTFHGFAINIDPDLDHFQGIVPCGIAEHPVCSLASIGATADIGLFDAALARAFPTFIRLLHADAGKP